VKKKYCFLIFCITFLIFSCAIFDDASDIVVSINLPDEIIISNYAFVSTLRSIDGEIIRSGTSVYNFHFDVDIPANCNDTVKIDDFTLQEGDQPRVISADFTYDM
jgi:hypothetical protein